MNNEKYFKMDFDLPISQPDIDEMVNEVATQLKLEANKELEKQFIKILKEALLSGDFTNVCMGNQCNLIYLPYKGIRELRNRYEKAVEILEKHGLLDELNES